MHASGLVIFDAFNTLVTARRGSRRSFLAGLATAGFSASQAALDRFLAASEGLDHSAWSGSREVYTGWGAETLAAIGKADADTNLALAPRVVPALEQLHQAPMVAMPGAADCLRALKEDGYTVAVCSNWGWDLAAELAATGLAASIDCLVTSAQAGYRKPHPRIYHLTLQAAGVAPKDAIFVGDSLRTDALGPQQCGIRSVLLTPSHTQRRHREQVASLAEVINLLSGGITTRGGRSRRLRQDR